AQSAGSARLRSRDSHLSRSRPGAPGGTCGLRGASPPYPEPHPYDRRPQLDQRPYPARADGAAPRLRNDGGTFRVPFPSDGHPRQRDAGTALHRIVVAPVTGRANIEAMIRAVIAPWSETRWEIVTLLSAGNVVVAERIDRTRAGERSVELPIVGVFELEEGKIRAWRDYFDLGTYTQAMT